MTDAFLLSLFDIFKAPWLVWSPATNLVQTAFLVCFVLGFIVFFVKLFKVGD